MNVLRRLLCFIVLAGVVLLAGSASAALPVTILRFNTLVDIANEDKITVTEEIYAEVLASGSNRGIYRDIPINPRWQDKGRRTVSLRVVSVSIDGAPQAADDIQDTWPFRRIYLRNRNQFLTAGVHKFVLQYEMTQQLGYFEKQDELTWNVTGSGWESGVGHSLCMVLAPEGAEFTNQRAWLGLRGEQTSPVKVEQAKVRGRDAVVFKAERAIRPGEDFTVAVAWPKGICKPASSLRPEDETGFTLSLAGLLGVALVFSALVWFRFGRDPQPGPAIPLFYPPELPERLNRKKGRKGERLSAAAVDYIWNKARLTSRGVAGLFLSLIERGDCTVEGSAKEGFVLHGVQVTSPIPEEADAARMVGAELRLDREDAETLSHVKDACEARLEKDYTGQWNRNFGYIALAFAPSVIGLYFLITNNLGPYEQWPAELGDYGILGLFMVVLVGLYIFGAYNLVRHVRVGMTLFGMALLTGLVAFLVWLGAGAYNGLSDLMWIFSPLQFLLMVAIMGVPALFAPIMDAPSREAAILRQQIAGLAMYIGAAETERLKFANPPDKPLELYHRLLPYAVVLGLEEAWGERFASELASVEAQMNGSQTILLSTLLLSSLITSTTVCIADYTARTQASSTGGSSFSGGGGAGSGGGGGGGGAC